MDGLTSDYIKEVLTDLVKLKNRLDIVFNDTHYHIGSEYFLTPDKAIGVIKQLALEVSCRECHSDFYGYEKSCKKCGGSGRPYDLGD